MTRPPPTAPDPTRRRRRDLRQVVAGPWRLLGLSTALAFAALAVWSLATPLFASPDEPAQLARAAAVVRGQLIGATVHSAADATTTVTVPAVFALRSGLAYEACFVLRATQPASCAPPPVSSTRPVRTTTYVGRYPPLYYAIVGLPSLVAVSPTGIYLMRLASDLLNALFIGLAVTAVWRWSGRRVILLGLVAGLTPMTWFLGSVVNPNGFEITTAVCLWTAGLVLVLEHAEAPPAGLVAIVAVAAAGLLLARNLSPLWAALIVATLALLGGWRSVASLLRARTVRRALTLVAPCGVFAVVWIVTAHALDLVPDGIPMPAHTTAEHLLAAVAGYTGWWIQSMVGIFGSLDTYAPLATYLAWYAVVGLVVLLALMVATARQIGALLLLVAAVLAVPVLITFDQVHRLGMDWQGRYTLPLAVGVPLVGAALVAQAGGPARLRRRLAVVVCTALGVADVAALLEALRRYTVGVAGPLDLLRGGWHPPLGTLTVGLGGVLVYGALMVLIGHLAAWSSPRPLPAADHGMPAEAALVLGAPTGSPWPRSDRPAGRPWSGGQ